VNNSSINGGHLASRGLSFYFIFFGFYFGFQRSVSSFWFFSFLFHKSRGPWMTGRGGGISA